MKSNFQFGPLTIKPEFIVPFVLILGAFLNAFYNLIATSLGFGFPLNTFLFVADDVFADYFKVVLSFPGLPIPSLDGSDLLTNYYRNNPYGSLVALEAGSLTHFHHPPLNEFIFIISRQIAPLVSLWGLYLFFISLWIVPLAWYVLKFIGERKLGFLIMLAFLLSYPCLMSITRGNVGSGIVSAALVVAILLSVRDKHPILTAVLIAVAVNVKPNAAVFMALFFYSYTFKRGAGYALLAIILSALIFSVFMYASGLLYPDYTIHTFEKSLINYYNIYVKGGAGLAYGSSGLGMFKLISIIIGTDVSPIIEFAVPSLSLFFILSSVVLHRVGLLSKIAGFFILTASYVLASGVFGDYHLMVLLAFIVLYSNQLVRYKSLDVNDIVILSVALLLMIPKNYIFFGPYSAQVAINPFLLLLAIIFVLGYPLTVYFESKRFYCVDDLKI